MTEFLPKFPFSEAPRDYQKQTLDTWIANKYKFFTMANKEYVEWLSGLKRRYKQNQLRTAVMANSELLEY